MLFDDPFGSTQLGEEFFLQPESVCEPKTLKRNAPGLSDKVGQNDFLEVSTCSLQNPKQSVLSV